VEEPKLALKVCLAIGTMSDRRRGQGPPLH
jgi:hypothetical protein